MHRRTTSHSSTPGSRHALARIDYRDVLGSVIGPAVPACDKARISFVRQPYFTPYIGKWLEHGRRKLNHCGISAD
jgi:hypothetical protein